MNEKSFEINGLLVIGIIIIVSFVYAINIQPVVFGNDTTFLPSNGDKYSYDLIFFRSYEELSSFLNNCSKFNYNYGASSGMMLKSNIEIVEDYNFSVYGDLNDIDFSQTNIQVHGVHHVLYALLNYDIQSHFQMKICKHMHLGTYNNHNH
jgi:hypothetical protein